MKKRSLFLVILLILSLCGCAFPGGESAEDAAAQRNEKYLGLYQTAAKELSNRADLTLNIQSKKITTVNNIPFTEESNQILSYIGRGTKELTAVRTETISIADLRLHTSEVFSDGICYLSVGSSGFYAETTAEAYLEGCTPAVLLDPSLYTRSSAQETADGTVLSFSNGTSAEAWFPSKDALYQGSEGFVVFDKNDSLRSASYKIQYLSGSYNVLYTVSVTYGDAPTNIAKPSDPEAYQEISDLQIPVLLEKFSMQLFSADYVTAQTERTLKSDAGAILWKLRSDVNMHGSVEEQMALINKTITTTDYSSSKEDKHWSQELFLEGKYTISSQTGDSISSDAVSALDIRDSCQALLIQGVLTAGDISGGTITEKDGIYTITLVPTQEFGDLLCRMACQILFDAPDLLKQLATDEVVNRLEAYISVDQYTGLPVAAGYTYQVTHMVDDILSYELFCKTQQEFSVPSATAYNTILAASQE